MPNKSVSGILNIKRAQKGLGSAELSGQLLALLSKENVKGLAGDIASAETHFQIQDELQKEAIQNINNDASAMAIARQALDSIADMNSKRMELARRAIEDGLSTSERFDIDREFRSLGKQVIDSLNVAEFRGRKLFSSQESSPRELNGALFSGLEAPAAELVSSHGKGDLTTCSSAREALDDVNSSGEWLSSAEKELSHFESRLDVALSNVRASVVDCEETLSRIMSADRADEIVQLTADMLKKLEGKKGSSKQACASVVPNRFGVDWPLQASSEGSFQKIAFPKF